MNAPQAEISSLQSLDISLIFRILMWESYTEGKSFFPKELFEEGTMKISSEEIYKQVMKNISAYLEMSGVDWDTEEVMW